MGLNVMNSKRAVDAVLQKEAFREEAVTRKSPEPARQNGAMIQVA
jgi:hypothetical protein